MTMVNVLFLHSCGDDPKGARKAIDAKRAERLGRTGYVKVLGQVEAAVETSEEDAARPRAQGRGVRPERRG